VAALPIRLGLARMCWSGPMRISTGPWSETVASWPQAVRCSPVLGWGGRSRCASTGSCTSTRCWTTARWCPSAGSPSAIPRRCSPRATTKEIWEVQAGLDFPQTVYGISREASARERMERQAEWFAAHCDDRILPPS
jgi:hypothetical protein